MKCLNYFIKRHKQIPCDEEDDILVVVLVLVVFEARVVLSELTVNYEIFSFKDYFKCTFGQLPCWQGIPP